MKKTTTALVAQLHKLLSSIIVYAVNRPSSPSDSYKLISSASTLTEMSFQNSCGFLWIYYLLLLFICYYCLFVIIVYLSLLFICYYCFLSSLFIYGLRVPSTLVFHRISYCSRRQLCDALCQTVRLPLLFADRSVGPKSPRGTNWTRPVLPGMTAAEGRGKWRGLCLGARTKTSPAIRRAGSLIYLQWRWVTVAVYDPLHLILATLPTSVTKLTPPSHHQNSIIQN